jgi:hypothetical protein
MNYLPPEYTGAHTLLAIIADPAAAKKRLDELGNQVTSNTQTLIETRKLATEVAAHRAENLRLVSVLDKARAENDEQLRKIAAARLEEREAALEKRELEVAEHEREADARHAEATALMEIAKKRIDKVKALQVD